MQGCRCFIQETLSQGSDQERKNKEEWEPCVMMHCCAKHCFMLHLEKIQPVSWQVQPLGHTGHLQTDNKEKSSLGAIWERGEFYLHVSCRSKLVPQGARFPILPTVLSIFFDSPSASQVPCPRVQEWCKETVGMWLVGLSQTTRDLTKSFMVATETEKRPRRICEQNLI